MINANAKRYPSHWETLLSDERQTAVSKTNELRCYVQDLTWAHLPQARACTSPPLFSNTDQKSTEPKDGNHKTFEKKGISVKAPLMSSSWWRKWEKRLLQAWFMFVNPRNVFFCTPLPWGSEMLRKLALFTVEEGRVIKESAGCTAPFCSLIFLNAFYSLWAFKCQLFSLKEVSCFG